MKGTAFAGAIPALLLAAGCVSEARHDTASPPAPLLTAHYKMPAMAMEDPWLDKGTANGMRFQMKVDTFGRGLDTGGREIVGASGRIETISSGAVELVQVYVTMDDCRRGMGTLHIMNVRGEPLADADFMSFAGNVASNMADSLCVVATTAGDLH